MRSDGQPKQPRDSETKISMKNIIRMGLLVAAVATAILTAEVQAMPPYQYTCLTNVTVTLWGSQIGANGFGSGVTFVPQANCTDYTYTYNPVTGEMKWDGKCLGATGLGATDGAGWYLDINPGTACCNNDPGCPYGTYPNPHQIGVITSKCTNGIIINTPILISRETYWVYVYWYVTGDCNGDHCASAVPTGYGYQYDCY